MMIEFSGPVWRVLFRANLSDPLIPARASEGRFHHSGQFALYASLSMEGVGVAIRRYISKDDPPRVIQQFQISKAQMLDVRGQASASVVWQGMRESGALSPTWKYSDDARSKGADGLLYSSRSRPELSHLVLFNARPALIEATSAADDWFPERCFGAS
ncbi:RES domain-containing protein [Ruegeria halocynthiae]|uniref:RES domain-containing protein n=1 Tax=Ruegeria halocynthiae TaxID=985054 RepID=A0A1H2VQG2_9RHOB|nr:RES family NAD+ phosphorylase [Ruegeria halocynthiae]SDW70531.1 RES domain-containing protein [Ruegeria halocynthiae]